jgi:hypothetical protein
MATNYEGDLDDGREAAVVDGEGINQTTPRSTKPDLGASSAALTKSKQRVADHGEVFTPAWMVDAMLDLVKDETMRIDARFLEPACGSGNFLRPVLQRKLAAVQVRYGQSDFERHHHALFALMCIYGVELLEDNVQECRQNLRQIFDDFIGLGTESEWSRAAQTVLEDNIIHGDALTLCTPAGEPIIFPEWGYLGTGRFQRRDFRFDSLTQRSDIKGSLFELLEEQDVFIPVAAHQPMTVGEIAR